MANSSEITEEITKKLADSGLIVEAGWVGFVQACKLNDAPPVQLNEMRLAFFAGAMHLFSSILNFLEPGHEATDKDLSRMDAVNDELKRFHKEFKARTTGQN